MTTAQGLALVRLAIVLAVMLVMYRQHCAKRDFLLALPLWAWMLHAAVYLVVYLVDSSNNVINPIAYNIWSAGVQIHGFLTILIIELARLQRQNRRSDDC